VARCSRIGTSPQASSAIHEAPVVISTVRSIGSWICRESDAVLDMWAFAVKSAGLMAL